MPDLRGTVLTDDYTSHIAGNGRGAGGRYFSVGYFELSRFVRRPGIESDIHLLPPLEFHADTTQLVQMLAKGHYGVTLDDESWDRLITWIDLNAPYHGTADDDFSPYANVADARLRDFASDPYTIDGPLPAYTKYDDWIPRDPRHDDGGLVTVPVGRYLPNAWGLHDAHGNVAEWTRSAYRPYPYDPHDGRDAATPDGRKAVRGGSWRDRPTRCRSAFRLSYPPWQGVYNVGFRVVCDVDAAGVTHTATNVP